MFLLSITIAFATGLACGGLIFVYFMRRYMVADYEVRGSFDSVNRAIMEAVPQFEGWSFPIERWEFYKSQLSKNLTYNNITNMVMHFVCKPSHANAVLRNDPTMGAIMPCTWAVYETTDGKVHIAKMNIGLMSKMYSGVIKEVMKDVAETESEMLNSIGKLVKAADSPVSDRTGYSATFTAR